MVENLRMLQKCLILVVYVEEQEVICENLVFVEYVLEKRLMHESYLELENLVGRIKIQKNNLI
jgi:hypothetical protein